MCFFLEGGVTLTSPFKKKVDTQDDMFNIFRFRNPGHETWSGKDASWVARMHLSWLQESSGLWIVFYWDVRGA